MFSRLDRIIGENVFHLFANTRHGEPFVIPLNIFARSARACLVEHNVEIKANVEEGFSIYKKAHPL